MRYFGPAHYAIDIFYSKPDDRMRKTRKSGSGSMIKLNAEVDGTEEQYETKHRQINKKVKLNKLQFIIESPEQNL